MAVLVCYYESLMHKGFQFCYHVQEAAKLQLIHWPNKNNRYSCITCRESWHVIWLAGHYIQEIRNCADSLWWNINPSAPTQLQIYKYDIAVISEPMFPYCKELFGIKFSRMSFELRHFKRRQWINSVFPWARTTKYSQIQLSTNYEKILIRFSFC